MNSPKNTAINTTATETAVQLGSITATKRRPLTRISRGGLDEINPDDIIYGEYSIGYKEKECWIDLVYIDGDFLRTFSGATTPNHPLVEELKILLRPDDIFYLVQIKEVDLGFAFKRTDIINIKTSSVISGDENHAPSCVWTMQFKDGAIRTLEADYQSYFAYGATPRPASMTNAYILDKVFHNER